MNRFICDQCQGMIGISQQMRVEERACQRIRYLAPCLFSMKMHLFEKLQTSLKMCPQLQQWNIFRGIPVTCILLRVEGYVDDIIVPLNTAGFALTNGLIAPLNTLLFTKTIVKLVFS